MRNARMCTRLYGRFRRRITLIFGLLLAGVVVDGHTRNSLGNPPEKSVIAVRNPQVLPPRLAAERIPLGIAGDYKPSLALLPGGDLLLVMFRNDSVGGGKIREDMIHYRSADDRLVLDEKTPANQPSGGGFGNTVQLQDGLLVSAYTYRGDDRNVHAEVVRWTLPDPAPE